MTTIKKAITVLSSSQLILVFIFLIRVETYAANVASVQPRPTPVLATFLSR
jgi:hypothetical protein